MKLDKKDIALLNELQKNCRQSLKKLARKLGMSITTVHDRMKKLEKKGVIKEYKAILNPDKTDNSSIIFILLRLDFRRMEESNLNQWDVAKKISKLPNLLEVYAVAGEWDMLLKVRAKDVQQISQLVMTNLKKIGGVGRTYSIHVWEVFKETTELNLVEKIKQLF